MQLMAELQHHRFIGCERVRRKPGGERREGACCKPQALSDRRVCLPFEALPPMARGRQDGKLPQPLWYDAAEAQVLAEQLRPLAQLRTAQQRERTDR